MLERKSGYILDVAATSSDFVRRHRPLSTGPEGQDLNFAGLWPEVWVRTGAIGKTAAHCSRWPL